MAIQLPLFLLIALLMLPLQSHSFEVEAYLTSTHTQRDKYWNEEGTEQQDFNDNNYGLGLKLPVSGNWSSVTGYYKNSYHNNSVFTGVDYGKTQKVSWQRNTRWFYGARALMVTGYDDTPIDAGYVMPNGFLYTGLEIDRHKLTFGTNVSAVFIYMSFNFDQ